MLVCCWHLTTASSLHFLNWYEQQTSELENSFYSSVNRRLLLWGKDNKRCMFTANQMNAGTGDASASMRAEDDKHSQCHRGQTGRPFQIFCPFLLVIDFTFFFYIWLTPFSSGNFHHIRLNRLENIMLDWRMADWRWRGNWPFLKVPHDLGSSDQALNWWSKNPQRAVKSHLISNKHSHVY